MKTFTLGAIFGLAAIAQAHMELVYPPPFRSKHNPNTPQASIDYSMTSPLAADGSNYPCKGYLSDFDGPAGASVATWQPGQSYNWTVAGSATHGGGSCQISLSYDHGATWKVIHSYVGNCPLKPTWDFQLPSDAPAGEAVFSWAWWNQIGNREMYQNCAHVTIAGGSKAKARRDSPATIAGGPSCGGGGYVAPPTNPSGTPTVVAPAATSSVVAPVAPAATSVAAPASPTVPAASPAATSAAAGSGYPAPPTTNDSSSSASWNALPGPFVANVGNGCGTLEGKDVLFPNPGPQIDYTLQSTNTAPPTGSCASQKRRAMPLKA